MKKLLLFGVLVALGAGALIGWKHWQFRRSEPFAMAATSGARSDMVANTEAAAEFVTNKSHLNELNQLLEQKINAFDMNFIKELSWDDEIMVRGSLENHPLKMSIHREDSAVFSLSLEQYF